MASPPPHRRIIGGQSVDPCDNDTFANSMWGSMNYNNNDSFLNVIQSTSISTALCSPFVRELVRHRKTHRWATPSIIPDLYLPKDIDMEYSISVAAFGSHLSMTGLLGEVAQRAAVARYADGCYYSVAGTTTSNHKVMRALSRAFCGLPLLACRNVHHSITHSSSMFGVPLRFLDSGGYCAEYEAVLPPSPIELERQLAEDSNVAAVLVTSPTYEGIIADVAGLAAVAHKYGRLLWIDQAWGSHLGWGGLNNNGGGGVGAEGASPDAVETASVGTTNNGNSPIVPQSAMQLGADFTTESTHKTGGAMQGASLLLWKRNERFTSALEAELYDAHCEHETTSPNFPIIASIDAALYRMTLDQHMVREAVQCASDLKALLSGTMPSMTMDDVMANATDKEAVYYLDPMRCNFSVPSGVSAFEMAAWLDKHGIVCEKNGLNSILFIATYQLPTDAPIKACALILRYLEMVKKVNAVFGSGAGAEALVSSQQSSLFTPSVGVAHYDTGLLSAIPPEAFAALAAAQMDDCASTHTNEGAEGGGGDLGASPFTRKASHENLSMVLGRAGSSARLLQQQGEEGGNVSAATGALLPNAHATRGMAIAAVPSVVANEDDDEGRKKAKELSALVAPQWLLNASNTRAVKVGPSSKPSRVVPFAKSVGMVAGETVECYPPGIPVIIPGYRITQEQLDYLTRMKEAGAHIVSTDKTMQTIRVRTDVD